MLREVNRFLARHGAATSVVAESGDMLFAGLDVRVGRGGGYLAQGYYASMGFGVPGALGAQIGTGERPLVLCGDGAFQMTGPEIAQAPRHGLQPDRACVMNNGGWGIFRPWSPQRELLDIPPLAVRRAGARLGRRGFARRAVRRAARRARRRRRAQDVRR